MRTTKTAHCCGSWRTMARLAVALLAVLSISAVAAQDGPVQENTDQDPADNSPTTTMTTVYACAGDSLSLRCDSSLGQLVRVERANFGRFSIAVCNDLVHTNLSVNCMAADSLEIVASRCNGKSYCEVAADATLFGNDPCPETAKYLEVHYTCEKSKDSPRPFYAAASRSAPFAAASSSIIPPWITSSTPSPFEDAVRRIQSSNSPTTTPSPPKFRVPITASPKHLLVPAADGQEEETQPSQHEGRRNLIISNLTAKFIHSSLSSTNIMDTSVAPVTFSTTKATKARATLATAGPTTTTTTTTTTTSTTTSATSTTTTTTSTTPSTTFASSRLPLSSSRDEDEMSYYPKFDPNLSNNPQDDVLITTHVLKESGGASEPLGCPTTTVRGVTFPRIGLNQEVTLSCPLETRGQARWFCGSQGLWVPTTGPDLSGCQSIWMIRMHEQFRSNAVSVVHLAKEVAHYVSYNGLYGGDIIALINGIGVMTEKMDIKLNEIPTDEQKEAVVMEIVQSVIKTASLMVSPRNAPGWKDLGNGVKKRRTITHFVRALKGAGLLLPKAVRENQEVTVSSPNILMSVKKVNFHHMTHTHYPSKASKATKEWMNYADTFDIPSLVLMENMERTGAETVFMAFKDARMAMFRDDHAKWPPTSGQRSSPASTTTLMVNSKVAFVSMRNKHQPLMPEPITAQFQHEMTENVTNPTCAYWDELNHDWATRGCHLLSTNSTHSECACSHLGLMALLEERGAVFDADGEQGMHVTLVIIIVSGVVLLFCLIVGAGIGLDYCRKVHHRHKWRASLQRSRLPCFQKEPETPARNFYSPSIGSNYHQSQSNSAFGSPAMSQQHYMEIPHPPPLNTRRPATAGPQSASASIRRKSTVYDHQVHLANNASPQQQQQQQQLQQHHSFTAAPPMATPERPLLLEQTRRPQSELSQQHIYMEVEEEPPVAGAGASPCSNNHFQPIHIPILVERRAESSNSSQSSGYYSSGVAPTSKSGVNHPLGQPSPVSRMRPMSLSLSATPSPATAAAAATAIAEVDDEGNSSGECKLGPLSPRRRLEIQDSQFI